MHHTCGYLIKCYITVQVIEPIDDMKAFDSQDAQLNLGNGTPRFYIMRLSAKPQALAFTQITHHKQVTQCLGAVTVQDWCVMRIATLCAAVARLFCMIGHCKCLRAIPLIFPFHLLGAAVFVWPAMQTSTWFHTSYKR